MCVINNFVCKFQTFRFRLQRVYVYTFLWTDSNYIQPFYYTVLCVHELLLLKYFEQIYNHIMVKWLQILNVSKLPMSRSTKTFII
jgi:hypothetical protein